MDALTQDLQGAYGEAGGGSAAALRTVAAALAGAFSPFPAAAV